MALLKLAASALLSTFAVAQYAAPTFEQVPQLCNIPFNENPIDYHKLSGTWYSIFDGKSLEEYKCL